MLYSNLFKQCRWSTVDFNNGEGLCEHIPLCQKISEFGKILIDPVSKVFTKLDLSHVKFRCLQILRAISSMNSSKRNSCILTSYLTLKKHPQSRDPKVLRVNNKGFVKNNSFSCIKDFL